MSPRSPRPSSALSPVADEALNLSSYLHLPSLGRPLNWREIFGNDRPVELEIGCGNGRFLALHAPQHPQTNFIGIEISAKYAVLAAQRIAKYKIPNVKISAADANPFLDERVPDESLSAVHIYFSDPWPKRRHARRRVFQYHFLDRLADALIPGSPLYIRTDVDWYFADIVTLVAEHPSFAITHYGEQIEFPEQELDMTGFESKALRQGRRVFYLQGQCK